MQSQTNKNNSLEKSTFVLQRQKYKFWFKTLQRTNLIIQIRHSCFFLERPKFCQFYVIIFNFLRAMYLVPSFTQEPNHPHGSLELKVMDCLRYLFNTKTMVMKELWWKLVKPQLKDWLIFGTMCCSQYALIPTLYYLPLKDLLSECEDVHSIDR